MQEINGGQSQPDDLLNTSSVSLSNSLNMSMKRKIGEDLILDKINRIFDEVQRDNHKFEEVQSQRNLSKNGSA